MTDIDYGPLRQLIGTWTGRGGLRTRLVRRRLDWRQNRPPGNQVVTLVGDGAFLFG